MMRIDVDETLESMARATQLGAGVTALLMIGGLVLWAASSVLLSMFGNWQVVVIVGALAIGLWLALMLVGYAALGAWSLATSIAERAHQRKGAPKALPDDL